MFGARSQRLEENRGQHAGAHGTGLIARAGDDDVEATAWDPVAT